MGKDRIMIVEDERLVAEDIGTFLKRIGCHVVSIVTSGEKALQKAAELQPDLVLMDIGLKGDLDGINTTEALNTYGDTPVIYLTGNGDIKTRERADQTRHHGFLLKPFVEDELKRAIEHALKKKSETSHFTVKKQLSFFEEMDHEFCYAAA